MNKLKPCPCGKTPDNLHISNCGQGTKYAMASGDCCYGWFVEFRANYEDFDSDECMILAIEEWNFMSRGE